MSSSAVINRLTPQCTQPSIIQNAMNDNTLEGPGFQYIFTKSKNVSQPLIRYPCHLLTVFQQAWSIVDGTPVRRINIYV